MHVKSDKPKFLKLYRARNSKCQYLLGNELFWWKYLLGPRNNKTIRNLMKNYISRVPGASKVKNDFGLFFDREWQSKKNFCIINLVYWQVYRVEKVGKYLLYLSKKSNFSILNIPILVVILKKLFSQKGKSYFVQIFFDYSSWSY